MFHIFLPVDDSLIDIYNGQFQRILGYVLKELAHGLVGWKPLH